MIIKGFLSGITFMLLTDIVSRSGKFLKETPSDTKNRTAKSFEDV